MSLFSDKCTFHLHEIDSVSIPGLPPSREREQAIELAVSSVRTAFERAGEAFPAVLDDYFRLWLADALELVRHYAERIAARTPLPMRLWTGTGGDIWARILRHMAYFQGAEVVGHDHGSGSGPFDIEINRFRGMTEFEGCTRFLTYTAAHSAGMRKCLATHGPYHVEKSLPKIQSLPEVAPSVGPYNPLPAIKSGGPGTGRLMYLSSFYFAERVNHQTSVPDLPFLDFEARLLAKLQEWGVATIYKPHPPVVTRAPLELAERFGAVEISGRPSEDVLGECDVLLLPDPMSTAFATALASGKPAVVIDLGLYPMLPEARSALARRAPIVEGRAGEMGRIEIDWHELKAAFIAARDCKDETYVRDYYATEQGAA